MDASSAAAAVQGQAEDGIHGRAGRAVSAGIFKRGQSGDKKGTMIGISKLEKNEANWSLQGYFSVTCLTRLNMR